MNPEKNSLKRSNNNNLEYLLPIKYRIIDVNNKIVTYWFEN